MSGLEIYAAIGVMVVVNYFTRLFPFLFFRKSELPWYITFIEKYFPAVIMTILIFYSIKDIEFATAPYGLKEIGGIVFTAVLHLWFKNYLVSIFAGTIFYMVLVQFL